MTQGYEKAVAAALGALADGLVVAGSSSAVAALTAARESGTDRAEFLITGGSTVPAEDCPSPGAPLAAYLAGDEDAVQAARAVLAQVIVVADLNTAADIVAAHPRWVAVTRDGDVLAEHWARGGVRDGSSALEMRAAAEEAQHEADRARTRVGEAAESLARAAAVEETATVTAEQAQSRWQDARARQAALGERATQLQRRLQQAERSRHAAEERLADLRRTQEEDATALASAQGKLREAEERFAEIPEPQAARQEELAQETHAARQAETEARLALRTTQERQAAIAEQAASAERAAEAERAARAKAAADERARSRKAAIAGEVLRVAELAQGQAAAALAEATEQRESLRSAATARAERLTGLRAQIREIEGEIARVTDSVHRDEVARAEQRLRIEQIAERALTDHGITTDVLVAEYGPDVPVPPSPPAPGDEVDPDAPAPEPYPFDRAEQERRLRAAEKSLALLGRVNPLALEEYAAMEERYTYLNEQIEDMQSTRADLLGIVHDVDARVEEVFADAFADTAEHFERVFARLFPGGEGRLVLTDPKNLLTSGIEVEARPPGKKVKRLSLLSGGERSLTAVAFLVSLFKARPSPFYVLDEVEAALDDTNLGRLIEVIEELQSSSQLIVITHQKRTMEAADALYGVSMRGDGVSEVISQRLRERAEEKVAVPEPTPA